MVARAQQLPIVGVLSRLSTAAAARNIEAFRRECGNFETRRVAALGWNFDMLMVISIGFRISQPI